jgi:hypothetical protein
VTDTSGSDEPIEQDKNYIVYAEDAQEDQVRRSDGKDEHNRTETQGAYQRKIPVVTVVPRAHAVMPA